MNDKKHILEGIDNDEERLFVAKLYDMVLTVQNTQSNRFTNFLDESRQAIAINLLNKMQFENFLFFGGFENATRKILGLFCDKAKDKVDFPIALLTCKSRHTEDISHRDVLGTLMSLGLTREQIGYILFEEDGFSFLVISDKQDYCIGNISKIKNIGVSLKKAELNQISNYSQSFFEKTAYLSSARLDNIIKAICNLSRESAKDLVLSKNVLVNGVIFTKIDAPLKEGDKISVRKKGKFIVDELKKYGNKDRLKITYRKYL